MVCKPRGESGTNKGRTRLTIKGRTRFFGSNFFASDERCPHLLVQRRRRRPEIVFGNVKLLLDLSPGGDELVLIRFQPFLWVWG